MHVIAYKLTDAEEGEHGRLIEALEEFHAVKIDKVNTLWKVRSGRRNSQMIYQSLKRHLAGYDIDADRLHVWIAKYDKDDVKYARFRL